MGLPNTVNQLFNGGSPYYIVNRSLRFRSSASATLSRTPSVTSNQRTWTWSAWVKRGKLSDGGAVFCCYYGNSGRYTLIHFNTSDQLRITGGIYSTSATLTMIDLASTAVYRDPAAWYHIVIAMDSTQATASNRTKMYVNGVQITAFSSTTYPALNDQSFMNVNTTANYYGRYDGSTLFFDGYVAETNFIDGLQLTPSSFGAFDTNGIWQPIRYSGTYGTNGFYLPFVDTSSTTNLVKDASGNGNNWTPNNISLTAGTTYDSMLDSPTVSNASSNYCVWNTIAADKNASGTGGSITNGNLYVTANGGASDSLTSTGTITFLGGKYYGEITCLAAGSGGSQTTYVCVNAIGSGAAVYLAYEKGGQYYNGSTWTAGWASWTTNDVIGLAVDQTTTTVSVSFYKNNVLQGTLTYSTGTTALTFATRAQYNASFALNCGQQPFTYTPPTGYSALNTANLPAATINYGAPYMNAVTYTGYGPLIPSGLGIPTKRNALNQNVSRSLRLRSSASAYLSRTIGSPSQTTNTLSVWVKRGSTISSAYNPILGCTATNSVLNFQFPSSALNDTIQYVDNNVSIIATNAVYRDPSAWVHVVFVWDTTNATQTDRLRLYVDGVRVTSFNYANYPALNATYSLFAASGNWQIGSRQFPGALYFDGYMAQFYYIDGQALTAASFGETNSDGVWVPKSYTGTYGTNGFYLPFTDTSSTTNLVKDSSGNNNNWTPNNISLTAGTTYDSMIDSPTDYASAGNYAVFNPLDKGAGITLSNANLTAYSNAQGPYIARSTIAVSSGKWYWEAVQTAQGSAATNNMVNGICPPSDSTTNIVGYTAGSYGYIDTGNKANNSVVTAYGATYGLNDIIGVALDLDNGTLTFYKNGVSQGVAFTGISGTFLFAVSDRGGGVSKEPTWAINFGQRPFTYSAPSGYSTLNTYNITAPSKTWFSSANNSGRGSATAYPDFVWIKSRSSAQNHSLNDTLRGPTLNLISNSTAAEAGASTMFNVNKYGLTLGNDASVNSSSYTDVMWGWQAGQGTTSTNTSGTITSTVSASASSGFSIATYTGTGVSNATVGHGLGVTPSMVIVKPRASATDNNWRVKHSSLSSNNNLALNLTDAQFNVVTSSNGGIGDLSSSSTFTLVNGTATNNNVNQSGITYIAYCFAAVRGYSAFGSYTGNGSADGPFIYLGFRPRFIIAKNATTGGVAYDWDMVDTARNPYNPGSQLADLAANLSRAEQTIGGTNMDILSNGFKMRSTDGVMNGNGNTIIYAAFAENPFQIARAR